jgi:Na+/melibiose symporter-like transporter
MSRELGEKSNLLDTPELRAYYANRPLLWRNLFCIGFSNIGWSIAMGVTGPLMALRLLDMGWTEAYSATVGSINLWLLSFLVMYFSWKSDHTVTKIGRRKPYLFIATGPIILATALFPFFNSLIPLVGLTLMKMMFTNLKHSTFPLLNIDCVERDMLARAQSLLMVASGIVMFLAMRLAPKLIEAGEWVPYAFGTAWLLVSCLAAWFVKEPQIFNPQTESFKPWSALKIGVRDRRILWLMLGVAMIASFETVFSSWTWIYAKAKLGLERSDIFEALSWASLVNIAIAFPIGWLIDKVGGFKVVLIYFAMMILNLFLVLQVHDATSLALFVAFMTISNPLNNAANIMVYKTSDPKEVGSVTSSLAFIINFYNGTLFFFSGWFIQLTNRNYHALFIIGAGLMAVGLLMFFIYRHKMAGPALQAAHDEKPSPAPA